MYGICDSRIFVPFRFPSLICLLNTVKTYCQTMQTQKCARESNFCSIFCVVMNRIVTRTAREQRLTRVLENECGRKKYIMKYTPNNSTGHAISKRENFYKLTL